MRIGTLFLAIFIAFTIQANISNVWAVDPGMYACLIDRMAGIAPQENANWDEKWRKRTSGTFQPEQPNFVLKISRHDEQIFSKDECQNPTNEYFKESAIVAIRCSGHVKLNAKIEDQYFFSLDGNNFLAVGPRDSFHTLFVGEGLGFVLTMINRLEGNFVQEGRCEKYED